MGHQIRDGKGTGHLAGVTPQNLLMTLAVDYDVMAYQSLKGYAFCAALSGISMNAAEKKVGWLQNSSNTHLVVVSCLTISAAANAELTFYGGKSTGYTSGGTLVVPNNINAASGRASVVLSGDCYVGDDLILSGGFGPMAKFLIGAYKVWSAPMYDSFVLGRGDAFALGVKSHGSGGEQVEAAFRYWELPVSDVDDM